uniref:Uncharacterized protein n=1 Tax=Oryza punctata TaxID=4537 RepID=A0A0E0KMV1_ORYPU
MGMKLKSTVNKPRTIDAIVIEDSSQESPRAKTLVPQLTEPIPNGERFPDIGYVHTLMKDCPKRHKTNVQIFEAIAAMGKGLQPDDFITEYYDQRVLAVLKAVLTNLEGKPLKGMLQYRAMELISTGTRQHKPGTRWHQPGYQGVTP